MERSIKITRDTEGKKVVLINEICFKGKRSVNWKDVEKYLKQYVNDYYVIADTDDIIYIGNDLPDEYCNSNYTHKLKGTSAKAKANATQGIPEMIEIASEKRYEVNKKEKHKNDAKYGWYRYDSRFALPVFDEKGKIERYNVFHVVMLMRHAIDNRIYLYDIIEIKKETSKLFQPNDFTQ